MVGRRIGSRYVTLGATGLDWHGRPDELLATGSSLAPHETVTRRLLRMQHIRRAGWRLTAGRESRSGPATRRPATARSKSDRRPRQERWRHPASESGPRRESGKRDLRPLRLPWPRAHRGPCHWLVARLAAGGPQLLIPSCLALFFPFTTTTHLARHRTPLQRRIGRSRSSLFLFPLSLCFPCDFHTLNFFPLESSAASGD
jgi:hypothetical protein